jgi:hypothetical protein
MHSNLSILVPISSLNHLSSRVLNILQPRRSSITISLSLITALHRTLGFTGHSHLLPSVHQNLIIRLMSKAWRPSSRVCSNSPSFRTLNFHWPCSACLDSTSYLSVVLYALLHASTFRCAHSAIFGTGPFVSPATGFTHSFGISFLRIILLWQGQHLHGSLRADKTSRLPFPDQ